MDATIESPYLFSYRFIDASVPPEYHRSYTIGVMPEKVEMQVDVYGTILNKYIITLKKAGYLSFLHALEAFRIQNKEESAESGCTGGKTDILALYIGMSNQLNGHLYYGGNKSFGNMEGDVAAIVALFKSLVPDLQKKVFAK